MKLKNLPWIMKIGDRLRHEVDAHTAPSTTDAGLVARKRSRQWLEELNLFPPALPRRKTGWTIVFAMFLGSLIVKADVLPNNVWPNPQLESVSSTPGVPTYWHQGGSDAAIDQWPVDSSVSPTHALKLDDSSPTAYGEWYSDRVSVVAGANYTLRYFLMHETTGDMRVSANFADASNADLSGVSFPFSGSQPDWTPVEQTLTAPAKATSMWITFASGGGPDTTGTAYLDDLSLVNESGEPVETPASKARVVQADYCPNILIDGNTNDWAGLSGGVITMDTQGRGTSGTMAVDIKYAWDATNLYILVVENTNKYTARLKQEASNGTSYQNGPWSVDTIAFWLDLDNDAGTLRDGSIVAEPNADFQPWFGFSSNARTDLMYARVNNSGNMNLDGLANARVATGGTFAQHNRVVEIAISWADMAAAVDPTRQPEGDLTKAITPGFTFGSEPLLIYHDYNSQAFLGLDQWNPPNGVDTNSIDIQLISSAKLVEAAYSSGIKVDGNPDEWANLPSGVITMDTQGRGTNGTMAVDIKYAWDATNLYILVNENANYTAAKVQQEAADGAAYQNAPWSLDTIAFWMDLDNDAGTLKAGTVVVENNADFQPWFGFSSSLRTDLLYARKNDSGTMDLDGLSHAKVATGGSFAQHNRVIEAAITWADLAAAVDPNRQPGGDITKAITSGFTFGCEPLLIYNDYNAQAFIGPDQWNPGNGVDSYSRDIRLVEQAVVPIIPRLSIGRTGVQVEIRWPVAAVGFTLETSSRVGTGASWTAVTTAPVIDGAMYKVTLSPAGTSFYRLTR